MLKKIPPATPHFGKKQLFMHKKHLQFVAITAVESCFSKNGCSEKDVIPVRPVNLLV
jgi:hypothetical protein